MENDVLLQLQQPGANPGGAPNWGGLTNPAFSQAVVDFALNRGYERLMMDVADLELAPTVITFNSVQNTFKYPIPPLTTQPAIHLVQRLFYAPTGLGYNFEFTPGVRLISWNEYQLFTANGYLQTTAAFGTQPSVAAVDPQRANLYFYPGSANSGDVITLQYAPIPTAGTAVSPLVNETDTPVLPADTHEAIVFWALGLLWVKGREIEAAMAARQQYKEEVARIRDLYVRSSAGSSMQIRDKNDALAMTYPLGPYLG